MNTALAGPWHYSRAQRASEHPSVAHCWPWRLPPTLTLGRGTAAPADCCGTIPRQIRLRRLRNPPACSIARWRECECRPFSLEVLPMTAKRKWAVWIAGTLSLAIAACVTLLESRGGHYPTYEASSFSSLAPPTASTAPASEPVVRIGAGTLRGTIAGSAVAFRGIPYARPPVGELRWRPPQPPLPWQGVREALQPGSACTQRASGLTPFFAPLAQAYGATFEQPPVKSSEDCLYLDVWLPEWPVSRPLPVMVWLHGGSNTVGSGTQSTYHGVSLTQHGVLLVTLNYRLGVMGFFSHPALTAESPHHSSGNYGLLDQLAALDWVKQNIAQFGGDPDERHALRRVSRSD